jgi:hypothetical protein
MADDGTSKELWRKALDWLRLYDVVPADEVVLQDEATAYDLAICLQASCRAMYYLVSTRYSWICTGWYCSLLSFGEDDAFSQHQDAC